jgi:hypothetical protein
MLYNSITNLRRNEKREIFSLNVVARVLQIVAFLLAVVLITGTFFALLYREPLPAAAGEGGRPAAGEEVFTGIGRQRLATKDGALLVLSVTFPYDAGDGPFSEELAARTGDFRALCAAWSAALSADEIYGKSEEEIKASLLGQFNGVLRLGSIKALYLNDFLIIQ